MNLKEYLNKEIDIEEEDLMEEEDLLSEEGESTFQVHKNAIKSLESDIKSLEKEINDLLKQEKIASIPFQNMRSKKQEARLQARAKAVADKKNKVKNSQAANKIQQLENKIEAKEKQIQKRQEKLSNIDMKNKKQQMKFDKKAADKARVKETQDWNKSQLEKNRKKKFSEAVEWYLNRS